MVKIECYEAKSLNSIKLYQRWNPTIKSCKGPKELACANSIMNKIGSIKLGLSATDINNVTILCLARCDSQENNIFMSQLIYPHNKHFQNHEDLCLIMEKIAIICSDPNRTEVFEKHYNEDPTCQEFIDYYQAKNETCGNEISLDMYKEDEKFVKLSTSIYDLVLLNVCHFHHQHHLQGTFGNLSRY